MPSVQAWCMESNCNLITKTSTKFSVASLIQVGPSKVPCSLLSGWCYPHAVRTHQHILLSGHTNTSFCQDTPTHPFVRTHQHILLSGHTSTSFCQDTPTHPFVRTHQHILLSGHTSTSFCQDTPTHPFVRTHQHILLSGHTNTSFCLRVAWPKKRPWCSEDPPKRPVIS